MLPGCADDDTQGLIRLWWGRMLRATFSFPSKWTKISVSLELDQPK